MERIEKYKDIVQEELTYRASIPIANAPEVKRHLIINHDRTEFVVLSIGWHNKSYRHNLVFHVGVKNGKVLIYEDNTDIGIADKFAENGIPKSDIILFFLPDYAREISGFAVV